MNRRGRGSELIARALASTSCADLSEDDSKLLDNDKISATNPSNNIAFDTKNEFLTTSTTIVDNNSSSSSIVSDFDSDDSVLDKDYVPPQTQKNNKNIISDSDSADDYIENSQRHNILIPESPDREDFELEEQIDELSDCQIQLTKKGTVRKRKHYDTSLKERKMAKKILKNNTHYSIKPGCGEKCKKKCSINISENQRLKLNCMFRNFTWREQHIFIANNTSQNQPARRTQKNPKINREKTVVYFLPKENNEKVSVCKIFFLTTLGFNKKNDKVVRNALKNAQSEKLEDKRGSNPNPKKIDNERIIDHINSYNPSISHYRREHAPNKKYLPSDVNARDMYKDFCEKWGITEQSPPEDHVSYDHYRRVIKQLNISFAKLGNEECETCAIYKLHNPNPEICHRNCNECKEFEKHRSRYILAREKYNQDKTRQMNNKDPDSDTMFYSVDLEKVIMCPRMDEFKVVLFCPRLILFNESFVPLGDKKLQGTRNTFACIWHEAISGRKKEDIASCFRAFFSCYRDLKHITLWLDNCASQNKNWTLFSYLVFLVNSSEVNFESVTMKYLEVGHTYMSADEFHHQVELSLKRKKKIYDFEDFQRAVSDTNRNIIVKSMDVGDFCLFEDCSSAYKLQNVTPRPYLNEMCEVIFRRGHNTLVYKTDFDGNAKELDFLRMKNVKMGIPRPVPNNLFRGVKKTRKDEIIKYLVPLMPENRKAFWYNLPCNENAYDLIIEHEG